MGELQRTARTPAGTDESPATERIEALVPRALSASSAEEGARLGDDLNALLLRLPSEPQRDASAALLRRLLDDGALAGLGTEKMPASIAATKALLDLGYPSALEVDPQHLEALRRWERERTGLPWLTILVTLFLVVIAQVAVVTLGAPVNRPFDPMKYHPDAVALQLTPEPRWFTGYVGLVEDSSLKVLGLQFLAGATAFLFTVAAGHWRKGRVLARRAFLSLSVLGGLVAVLQLPAGPWLSLATSIAAVGAFISAARLKAP
ncbi:hypothetical protein [Myxococcus sp. CA039A]|uniref:hypothetical protein n=1 Tax=Myxococcus sp. CA039A TaxID=2741737 RepID=UPI00157A7A69|nr:hypothetical protein [Myxococcus sp. CA039A]NTX57387.1 hypothetical protein [Myxococcus sp. CA039A]